MPSEKLEKFQRLVNLCLSEIKSCNFNEEHFVEMIDRMEIFSRKFSKVQNVFLDMGKERIFILLKALKKEITIKEFFSYDYAPRTMFSLPSYAKSLAVTGSILQPLFHHLPELLLADEAGLKLIRNMGDARLLYIKTCFQAWRISKVRTEKAVSNLIKELEDLLKKIE